MAITQKARRQPPNGSGQDLGPSTGSPILWRVSCTSDAGDRGGTLPSCYPSAASRLWASAGPFTIRVSSSVISPCVMPGTVRGPSSGTRRVSKTVGLMPRTGGFPSCTLTMIRTSRTRTTIRTCPWKVASLSRLRTLWPGSEPAYSDHSAHMIPTTCPPVATTSR